MSETLSPKELAKKGKNTYERGDYLAAAQAFKAASQGYTSAGNKLTAAEMDNNASVAYLQAGEAESALTAVVGTAEIFAQAGDLRRQGMAIGNYAAALEALERLDEADQAYRESAEILKQAGEDALRANVMQSLSTLQFRTGKQLQALATMKAGLEDIKKPSPRQRFLKRLLNIPFDMLNRKKN
jgi:tetratricopeptide (TPR) repeat protein